MVTRIHREALAELGGAADRLCQSAMSSASTTSPARRCVVSAHPQPESDADSRPAPWTLALVETPRVFSVEGIELQVRKVG